MSEKLIPINKAQEVKSSQDLINKKRIEVLVEAARKAGHQKYANFLEFFPKTPPSAKI